MNNNLHPHQKEELAELAVIAMRERGLAPAFGPAVRQQLERIDGPAEDDGPDIIDLTGLPWCSIDNDDSRDLDQLTVSQTLPDGSVKILVAIADVDALVARTRRSTATRRSTPPASTPRRASSRCCRKSSATT